MPETIGQNISIEIKDGKVIITFDLSKRFGQSGSGKSTIVASTQGNVLIPGTSLYLGLNAYEKNTR